MSKYDCYVGNKLGDVEIVERVGSKLKCKCKCGSLFLHQANDVISGKRTKCVDCSNKSRIIFIDCESCGQSFEKYKMHNSNRFGLVCENCYMNKSTIKCKHNGCEEVVYVSSGNHSHLCEQHRDIERVAYNIYHSCKRRARQNKLDFDLDKNWIIERLDKCEVTGVELEIRNTYKKVKVGRDYSNRSMYCPSVDKIVPELGYVKENCRVVCWWYNLSKSIWTDEEVFDILNKWIENKGGICG